MNRLNIIPMGVFLLVSFGFGSVLYADNMIASDENAYANKTPIADAGLSRYVAIDPIQLDGTLSYDPDESGPLAFAWQQVSGPVVQISEADTTNPTISGFIQTDEIQECEFELVVSDGELTSRPDTVKIVIVPDFGNSTLQLENPPFDPNKPTLIYFEGGDSSSGDVISGMNGLTGPGQLWNNDAWSSRANVISFPAGYYPDSRHYEFWATYYQYGDLVVVYLSRVAPKYRQPIQTMGFSGGGMPMLDVGIRLNAYSDTRYAVHHVTAIDAATRAQPEFKGSWDLYNQGVELFLNSSVDGEPCWLDFYYGAVGWPYEPFPRTEFLRARSGLNHGPVLDWYRNSMTSSDMNQFNGGVVAGAYWSVVGPGKNLQLARTDAYYFEWDGGVQSGSMDFYDETQYPGRLPEPVTLIGPADGAAVDANGVLLSCEESENAVGYRLLFGADPHHMVYLRSDTPAPPDVMLTTFPFPQTWWTVQAYDQYGSAIHADPLCVRTASVEPQNIENLTIGRTYTSIQQAINDAQPGDEIVLDAGACHYRENLDFKGKNLTLRSTDPNVPSVVAATVISARPTRAAITMSGSMHGDSVLAGLTILGGTVGVSCAGASLSIRNCTIESGGADAIEYWYGYEPDLVNCTLVGAVTELDDPRLIAYWRLDESEGINVSDSVGNSYGFVLGSPAWQPTGGKVDGALAFDGATFVAMTRAVLNPYEGPFSVFAWMQGGAPGQVIFSQQDGSNWLMADPTDGSLMTELEVATQSPRDLDSGAVITDGDWHRIGLTWDGEHRRLYVDDVLVTEDTQIDLKDSDGSHLIGCGKDQTSGTFFAGLIDDVRIYDRAVQP